MKHVLPGSTATLRILAVLLVALLAAITLNTSAAAGEYFEKEGVAIRGYDPVAYFSEGKPVKGAAAYTAYHKGSVFHFSSAANRDAFSANPTKYAPQYGGFCAYGTAGGYKAAIDPAAFSVVDGKLYLNYDGSVQKLWARDIPGFIVKADKNWPAVSAQSRVID